MLNVSDTKKALQLIRLCAPLYTVKSDIPSRM